jgi:hypothetical protein
MVLVRAVSAAVLVLVVLGCAGADTSPPAQAGLAPVAAELVAEPAPAPVPALAFRKPETPEYLMNVGPYQTLAFDVLDIDFEKQKVAFRHVYRPMPYSEEPVRIDCAYAGVEPGASVTLGVWDLKEGKPSQWWDVYMAVFMQEHCMNTQESSAKLAEAKAAFARLGLDTDASPRPEKPSQAGLHVKKGTPDDEFMVRDQAWYGSQLLFTVTSNPGRCGREHLAIDRFWRKGDQVLILQSYDSETAPDCVNTHGSVWQMRWLGPLLTIP